MADYNTMDEYIVDNPLIQEDANLFSNMDESTKSIETEQRNGDKSAVKQTQLPLSRIRQIMKCDPDVTIATQEAVFLITKSTELFLQSLANESVTHTVQAKRKTLQRKDMDKAIGSADSLAFLEGALDN